MDTRPGALCYLNFGSGALPQAITLRPWRSERSWPARDCGLPWRDQKSAISNPAGRVARRVAEEYNKTANSSKVMNDSMPGSRCRRDRARRFMSRTREMKVSPCLRGLCGWFLSRFQREELVVGGPGWRPIHQDLPRLFCNHTRLEKDDRNVCHSQLVAIRVMEFCRPLRGLAERRPLMTQGSAALHPGLYSFA